MIDPIYDTIIANWEYQGVSHFKVMPDGSLAAVKKQLFTYGIVSKLEMWAFSQRWCFENILDAKSALDLWNGEGDPPGPWLKTFHPERHNLNMFKQRADHPYIWDRIPENELNISKIWPR